MKTLITHLFVAFVIIILPGCENENNSNSAPKSYTVLEAIEGTWKACEFPNGKNWHDRECTEIGEITIQDGLYQFNQIDGVNKEMFTGGKLDFLFDAPSGKVKIEYYNSKPNDSFQSYSENDILAEISFISEQQEIKRGFYIRVNKKNKSLYFHSLVSEISQWGVWKEL